MKLAVFLGLIFFAQIVPAQCQTAADLPLLKSQTINTILANLPTSSQIRIIQSRLQSNGSFSDINYALIDLLTAQERASWPVATHMQRVQFMAQVYSANTSVWYLNSEMKANFSKAFDYWFSGAFTNTNPNWFANQITIPTYAGRACLLMRAEITTTQHTRCLALGAKANWTDWTGQNVVWQAEARLFFALMEDDFDLALSCVNAIKSVLVIAPGMDEGIKVDGSFLQHGPQLYNGGYGTALTSDLIGNVIPAISGTAFDFSGTSIDALSTVFLEGHQWMINTFGTVNTWHVPPLGREVTRIGAVADNMPPVDSMRRITGSRSAEFNAFVDRFQRLNVTSPLIGNRAYWTSDYLIHNRANYSIGVKMYSQRTYNAECVNVEGRRSLKMSDGSMFIYNGAEEYVDIWGAFDWEKVPGITSEVDSIPFICTSSSNTNIQIKNSPIKFAGTTSDGTYGVTGYAYLPPPSPAYNSTLSFKKSWFYFDSEIVILASDINSNSSYDIITTLDQRRVNGPIYTSASNTVLAKGLHDLNGEWWVHHDRIGYILPQVKESKATTNLFVENVNKTGNWKNINNIMTQVDTNELFTIWIQGQSPNAMHDSHELIILPGVSYDEFPLHRDAALANIEVLSNTADVQAVYHKTLNILSSSFYTPGSISANQLLITVETPCIVMVVFTSLGFNLHISDPIQTADNVTVSVNKVLSCNLCQVDNDNTVVTINLPKDNFIGSTTSVFLQSAGSPNQPSTPGSVPPVAATSSSANILIHLFSIAVLVAVFV